MSTKIIKKTHNFLRVYFSKGFFPKTCVQRNQIPRITKYTSNTHKAFKGFSCILNKDPKKTKNRIIINLEVNVKKTYFENFIFVKESA